MPELAQLIERCRAALERLTVDEPCDETQGPYTRRVPRYPELRVVLEWEFNPHIQAVDGIWYKVTWANLIRDLPGALKGALEFAVRQIWERSRWPDSLEKLLQELQERHSDEEVLAHLTWWLEKEAK